ncbi:MAG: hypothetical protein LBR67_10200 [Dysgonamonadaceae bacterium]|jgi:hypothetical protein|nr:hypothetical protein [Dysgonamonadaceae bacterium]
MNRRLHLLTAALLSILLCSVACDRLFVDIDGVSAKLQGKWQQTDDPTVYFNFQNQLFQYQQYLYPDSILSVFGFYNLIDEQTIRLKLLAQTQINSLGADIPLDFLQWDTLPGTNGMDTLTQQFSIKLLNRNNLNLSNSSKNHVFRKY